MKVFDYLKTLVKTKSGHSSKSFGLLLSSIVGALIGLCVCFILVWDVVDNNVIDTPLDDLGIFLLCDGAFMFGGGVNKVLGDKYNKPEEKREGEKEEELG